MSAQELGKLRRQRQRIQLHLDKLQALTVAYLAKLTDVEARIRAVSPELDIPNRAGIGGA